MTPHIALSVAYADTSAAHLGFSLSAAEQEPLARADATLAGIGISVRLLGASHQVVIDDGAHRLCETVACLPDLDSSLPASFQQSSYVFGSTVEELDADAMHALVVDLTQRVQAHRVDGLPALIGAFPGIPDAVTAIVASASDDETLTWETWHTYPQTGEVVATSSSLARGEVSR